MLPPRLQIFSSYYSQSSLPPRPLVTIYTMVVLHFKCSHQSMQVPRNVGINYLLKLLPFFLEVCRPFFSFQHCTLLEQVDFLHELPGKAGSAVLKVSGLLAQLAAVHRDCSPGEHDSQENKIIRTTCMLKEVEDREDGWHGRFLTLPSGLSHVRGGVSPSSGQLQEGCNGKHELKTQQIKESQEKNRDKN